MQLKVEPKIFTADAAWRKMFDDEHLDILSHGCGTTLYRFRGRGHDLGLDGIMGLIPGIGDMMGGIASCIIIVASWVWGVPGAGHGGRGDRGGGGRSRSSGTCSLLRGGWSRADKRQTVVVFDGVVCAGGGACAGSGVRHELH